MLGALSISFCCFGVLIILFLAALFLLFNAAILWGVSMLLSLDKKDFKTACYTVLTLYTATIILNIASTPLKLLFHNIALKLLVSLVFFIAGFALSIYIVRQFYETTWAKAASAYILSTLIAAIIGFIVFALAGLAMFSMIGSSMKAMMAGMPI